MEKTHQWGFPLIAANPTIRLHPGSNLSPFKAPGCVEYKWRLGPEHTHRQIDDGGPTLCNWDLGSDEPLIQF